MDFLSADSLPWLRPLQQRLRESLLAQRLPHALLCLSAPGLGAEHLTDWLAALVLCESPAQRPCGACPGCALLRADTHPDLHVLRLEEDKSQISVKQIRELIGELALKSHRRGYKVAVIEGAENLNTNAANAFLKTLEEPFENSLLVLIAGPTHRLPATIASRCMRLALRPPPTQDAIAWLTAQPGCAADDWRAALALAAGAPLKALELNQGGVAAQIHEEMTASLRTLAAGADLTLVADHWTRSNLALRLAWLENWITRRVQRQLGDAGSDQSAERVRLPEALLKPKIRALFELLDGARELRRLASTSINQQLALEALLLGGRTALGQ